MITADTITEEQILRLRDQALAYGRTKVVEWCDLALYVDGDPKTYREARERCAKILTALKAVRK